MKNLTKGTAFLILLLLVIPFNATVSARETERTTDRPVERIDSYAELATVEALEVELPAVEIPGAVSDTLDAAKFKVDASLRKAGDIRSHYLANEIVVKYKNDDRPIRVGLANRTVADALSDFNERSNVEYAEPNYVATAFMVPNDPLYPYQWHFDNGIEGGVNAEEAWDVSSGSGAVVAVIDTGVAYEDYGFGFWNRYYQAPDLAGTNFVAGYDFVNNDSHPNDDEGHGTHVAGTIAGATNNGDGVAGLAYSASIMPIKVLDSNGSGSYYDVAEGIRFAADHGADVINLSLGGPSGASYLEDALQYAHERGVTIVAAAGNDGNGTVSYPAAYDDYVIAVGATRFDETKAYYSNYGPSLDLMAPGGDVTVDQNDDGYGDGVLQQTFGNSRNDFGYYFYQGTSMAAPHAAAAAAIVMAGGVTDPAEVQAILEASADDLGAPGRDNSYGHGLLNLAAALNVEPVVTPPEPEPDPQPEPDTPPTLSFTYPSEGETVSGEVVVTVTATDDNGVEQVDFYVDGVLLNSDASEPFAGAWDTTSVSDDTHELVAVAIDTVGQTATATLAVTVDNYVPPAPVGDNIIVLRESFENGLGDWVGDEQRKWGESGQRATDGTESAEVDGSADDSTLTSPVMDLLGKSNVRISYDWLIERRLDTGEYLAFDVSTNGGATWQEMARLRGNQDREDVWFSESFELSGLSGDVMIRYRATMSRGNEDANVDNIVVEAF